MRIPSNAELIALWERAAGEPPVERALMMLAACGDEPRSDFAALSVGTRDAQLLTVHERLFGSSLDAFAECPECHERLEYSLSTHDLNASTPQGEFSDPLLLQLDGFTLSLRVPNSLDLQAASACIDVPSAERTLMQRCVITAEEHGDAVPPEALPAYLMHAVSSALAAADPQAEMWIDLSCGACGHQWQVLLDIERFLWSKITRTAKRLLREIHILASSYGWTETDILALSSVRRHTYAEMAWPAS